MLKLEFKTALALLSIGPFICLAGIAAVYWPAALILGGAGLTAAVWFLVEFDPPRGKRR